MNISIHPQNSEVNMITVECEGNIYGFQRGEDQRGNWFLILGSCPVLFNQGSSGRHKILPIEFGKDLARLAIEQDKGSIKDFSLYPIEPPKEKKPRNPNHKHSRSRMVGIPLSALLGM